MAPGSARGTRGGAVRGRGGGRNKFRAEGMIRDRLVAPRAGKPSPYTDQEIRAIFFALLIGLR